MKHVFINGNRNGYTPEQCGGTMTVRELISYLEQFEDDQKVYMSNDNGYTYGSINESDFIDEEDECYVCVKCDAEYDCEEAAEKCCANKEEE